MDNIKKNLRSVLLSQVGGVALKNVERDYKNLVGEKLNWRQFGFESFEAFLNDIPDVVKVAFKKDAMHAFGVAENMSYINPTARKAQFKERPAVPQNGTSSNTGQMTVYIGNLPLNVTKEILQSYLSGYAVEELQLAKHQNSSSAWVTTSKEVGQQMCSKLDKKRYDDRMLKVEPARKPSAYSSSGHSSAVSVSSSGEAFPVKNPTMKNNSVNSSLNSADVLSSVNGVGKPLHQGITVDPIQQRRSQSNVEDSVSALAPKSTAYNHGNVRSSKASGFKDSETSRFNSGADFRKDYSDFLCRSEPPPLIGEDDWEECLNGGGPSKSSGSQRVYVKQTCDEPPPLTSRADIEKMPWRNEVSSSNSWPINSALEDELSNLKPYGDTYNLYVKNIPLGTTTAELSQLFKNAVKIVCLSQQSCFAVFNTFHEVEDASRRNWTIRGVPIFADVATRHKNLISEPESLDARNGGRDQIVDSGLADLTCTVGYNNERKVKLSGQKLLENKSSVSKHQTTSALKEQESIQLRSSLTPEMPHLVSKADLANSRVNVQPPPINNNIPPLLSMDDIVKIRENRPPLTQKTLPQARLGNSGDFSVSTQNDVNSKQLYGPLNYQADLQAPVQRTLPSKPVNDFSNFDGDFQTSNWKALPSKQIHNKLKSQLDVSSTAQTVPSMKHGNSVKNLNNFHISAPEVMPVLQQRDNPISRGNFQPSSAANEVAGVGSYGCAASPSSQLPMVSASSQSAPSVAPLRPIPDEMRLKELQRMLTDTFPGDTLPTSHLLPDIIDVIIICVVPGFENSCFWGQVASEPFESELQRMYDLIPKMEEISGSLKSASAALRRGAAKYGEDWCRIWIKHRGETASTVFFIDFGNFETISNNNIYELPEEFWRIRPTALPFRVLDAGKLNLSEYINQRVTANVNKKSQRGCVFEIHDLRAPL